MLLSSIFQGGANTRFPPRLRTPMLPTIVARMYAYADDLAIMHGDGDWQAVEGILNKDMVIVGEYLQT